MNFHSFSRVIEINFIEFSYSNKPPICNPNDFVTVDLCKLRKQLSKETIDKADIENEFEAIPTDILNQRKRISLDIKVSTIKDLVNIPFIVSLLNGENEDCIKSLYIIFQAIKFIKYDYSFVYQLEDFIKK